MKFKCTTSFDDLERAMTQAPVLSLPDFTQQFIIQMDTLRTGMGAVLNQNGHPICYLSKKLCPKLLNSSMYVWELHAT